MIFEDYLLRLPSERRETFRLAVAAMGMLLLRARAPRISSDSEQMEAAGIALDSVYENKEVIANRPHRASKRVRQF